MISHNHGTLCGPQRAQRSRGIIQPPPSYPWSPYTWGCFRRPRRCPRLRQSVGSDHECRVSACGAVSSVGAARRAGLSVDRSSRLHAHRSTLVAASVAALRHALEPKMKIPNSATWTRSRRGYSRAGERSAETEPPGPVSHAKGAHLLITAVRPQGKPRRGNSTRGAGTEARLARAWMCDR